MALITDANKKSDKKESNRAVAFMNYSIPTKDGMIKVGKGFPIFQNPKYQDRHQDLLVKLAERNGGVVEMMLPVRICINKAQEVDDLDLDNIVITPADNPADPDPF